MSYNYDPEDLLDSDEEIDPYDFERDSIDYPSLPPGLPIPVSSFPPSYPYQSPPPSTSSHSSPSYSSPLSLSPEPSPSPQFSPLIITTRTFLPTIEETSESREASPVQPRPSSSSSSSSFNPDPWSVAPVLPPGLESLRTDNTEPSRPVISYPSIPTPRPTPPPPSTPTITEYEHEPEPEPELESESETKLDRSKGPVERESFSSDMTRSEYHATGKEDPSRSEKKEKNRNSVSVSIHTVDGEEGTSSEIDHHHQHHRHQPHPNLNIVENNLEPRANATPSPSALSSSSGAVAAAAAARRISVLDADSIVLSRLHPRSKTRGSASRGSRSSSWSFWLSFLAINISIFISAMSFMAIGTVLPTVANALGDRRGDFTWIGSAYALSMTCFIPLSGTMSDIFGRKPTLLLCIICFALGSALAGASQNMTMMISAQAIQGIGGGGMISITEMIISDLVSPSDQRSKYQGVLGLTWSLASAVAPIIGGAFASNSHITWRWLFYLNLPLTGVAGGLIAVFLDVPHPKGSALQKLVRVDWIGNAIIIFGCGLTTIGLAWGGVRFPWSSAQVLVPLILGFTLLLAFGVYETRISKRPLVKLDVFYENRTALSGLLGTAAHGIASTAFIFFMPVYFQAVLGHSPVHSAIDFLSGVLVIVTAAFTAGIVVTYTGLYRPVIYIGWGLMMIGFGLLSMLKEGNEVGKWVGYQVVVGAGAGLLFSTPNSSIAASLSPNQAASALSFSNFVRAFAQTWGITIASTILQNLLKRFLPTSTSFPGDSDIAFAAIPAISSLPEGLKAEVRDAFARSIAVIWQTMIGICGLGLLGSFLMKEVKTSSHCCSKRKASTAYVLKEGLSDDLTFTSNGLRNGSTFEDESGRRDRRNRDVEAGGIAMEVRENMRRYEEVEMQRTDT